MELLRKTKIESALSDTTYKFGMSYNNQHQTITSVSRFAWCMIFLGNTLVRDFIPVRFTNENGVTEGAMYDRVSGALFRNAGTGAFTIGPNK